MKAKQLQNLKFKIRNKFILNPPIENIDYATQSYQDGLKEKWWANFIGFVVLNSFHFGYYGKDNLIYVPLYIGYEEFPLEHESNDIAKNNPYVLMFYGSDNYSDFIRFKSFDLLKNTLLVKDLDAVRKNSQIHFYNS